MMPPVPAYDHTTRLADALAALAVLTRYAARPARPTVGQEYRDARTVRHAATILRGRA